MRKQSEVGSLNFNKETNDIYLAYASIYLDFVNDNIGAFLSCGVDIQPLVDSNVKVGDNKSAIKAYSEAAICYAKAVLQGKDETFVNDFFANYPPMVAYKDRLIAA